MLKFRLLLDWIRYTLLSLIHYIRGVSRIQRVSYIEIHLQVSSHFWSVFSRRSRSTTRTPTNKEVTKPPQSLEILLVIRYLFSYQSLTGTGGLAVRSVCASALSLSLSLPTLRSNENSGVLRGDQTVKDIWGLNEPLSVSSRGRTRVINDLRKREKKCGGMCFFYLKSWRHSNHYILLGSEETPTNIIIQHSFFTI